MVGATGYNGCVLQVAVPSPLRSLLDYLPPQTIKLESSIESCNLVGRRVLVPLGSRQVVGIIVLIATSSTYSAAKLKEAIEYLDDAPLLSNHQMKLLSWVSSYYHYPIGDVFCRLLPKSLQEGVSSKLAADIVYRITAKGIVAVGNLSERAHRQKTLLNVLLQEDCALSWSEISLHGITKSTLMACIQKEFIDESVQNKDVLPVKFTQPSYKLSGPQQAAIAAIDSSKGFSCFVLQGVTGSGKTEVYLQCMHKVLRENKKVLLLVPEIALTPQTQARVSSRFNVPVLLLHSGLSARVRSKLWLQAGKNGPCILLGTRSAIFAPLPKLGLIILDEEHDVSYKQQSGLRYSARDVAIMRAQMNDIPIVLGSATPSLEVVHNIKTKGYIRLWLRDRVGGNLPNIVLQDMRGQKLTAGLVDESHAKIKQYLDNNKQVLLFLNRRGYAPVLMCHQCGWSVLCPECDAKVTMHNHQQKMRCHHCDRSWSLLKQCKKCCQSELQPVGVGTERLLEDLTQIYQDKTIIRIDRDTVSSKKRLNAALDAINTQQADIIIGTQMISKGHHFSNVGLVVVVDADGGLYSIDYRAVEHMGQQILQVAGRSGRETQGEVIIQTHHPDNYLLKALLDDGYEKFADILQQERAQVGLPPHSFQALIRVESKLEYQAKKFLIELKKSSSNMEGLSLFGPMSAPMPKINSMYRFQLVIQGKSRSAVQQWLKKYTLLADKYARTFKCRWSVDVDPIEMG